MATTAWAKPAKDISENRASEMNDYECTLLAGVPNAPSKYAPSKNLALAEKRQQKVISRMEACGYITEEETTLMAAQLVALY